MGERPINLGSSLVIPATSCQADFPFVFPFSLLTKERFQRNKESKEKELNKNEPKKSWMRIKTKVDWPSLKLWRYPIFVLSDFCSVEETTESDRPEERCKKNIHPQKKLHLWETLSLGRTILRDIERDGEREAIKRGQNEEEMQTVKKESHQKKKKMETKQPHLTSPLPNGATCKKIIKKHYASVSYFCKGVSTDDGGGRLQLFFSPFHKHTH